MLVRARAHEINWRLWMDGAIAALGTAALGAAFVFDFVAEQTTGHDRSKSRPRSPIRSATSSCSRWSSASSP